MFSQSCRVIFLTLFLCAGQALALSPLLDQADKSISLDQFQGKYVVLEWLNFKCHMLKGHYEAMHIQRAQKKLKEKNVVWISILSQGKGHPSYYDNATDLQAALVFHAWDGNHALRDTNGEWGKFFAAKKTPFNVLLDPMGKVIYQGALDDSNPFSHSEESLKKSRNFLLTAMQSHKAGKKIKIAHYPSYGCPIRYPETVANY